MTVETPFTPTKEKGFRNTPYMVFKSSPTGYLSKELFKEVTESFIFWWTSTRPGLECVLLSDNLPIHRNKEVVAMAESNGIHMLNIMTGSSHRLQVHDQLPLATLKKFLGVHFYDCFQGLSSLSDDEVKSRMAEFYKAEENALQENVLLASFNDVGLVPWNPDAIMRNARDRSPTDTQASDGDKIDEFAKKLAVFMDAQNQKREELLS